MVFLAQLAPRALLALMAQLTQLAPRELLELLALPPLLAVAISLSAEAVHDARSHM